MKVGVTKTTKDAVCVYPVFRAGPARTEKPQTNAKEKAVARFLEDNKSFGKLHETQLLYDSSTRILLVGAGKQEDIDFAAIQAWAGTATKALLTFAVSLVYVLPPPSGEKGDDIVTPEQVGEAIAIGTELALHDPSRDYKSEKQPQITLKNVNVFEGSAGLAKGLDQGYVVAQAINLTRKLGDTPPNEMTPTEFVHVARRVAREGKMKITVLSEAQAKKRGMNTFVAVAKGSDEPSFMIAIEYTGDHKSKEKWGFVGKGITFDTGGLSLKPGDSMVGMKYDMSGAGAVLGALLAISKLKPKANVVGIMAVAENSPSGRALRPSDIIKTYSGKTAEVLNTDAEGRLVLVDALTFAQKDFKATKLVDLATLTGAIIVALGGLRAGVFGNKAEFTQKIIATGERAGDKMWELPMDKEYNELIKSNFADIANLGHGSIMGNREAGSIAGAKFIEAVIEDGRPWVHIDIAGVAEDPKPKPYRGPGATGFGVKTLVALATS